MTAQDLVVNLYGKDISYSDALKKMALVSKRATIEASTHFDDMGRKIEESGKTAGSGFGSNLASWAQSGLAGILGGIAASVTSSVMGVVSDAGDAILSQLKTSVIDYNSTLEQATIGFTTMLGSSGQAQKFLDQLQAFATRTPFEFGDLTTFSQQMLAYGVNSKNVIPYLTALGDAAAGAGKNSQDLGNAVLAFNQLSAKSTVDLGNLNQLTNNGIPALAILADKYGVTKDQMFKMISSSKILSADALPKLIDGIEHGTKSTAAMGGMMNKQSSTLQGAMSNISDAMNQTLSKAFLPFFKVVERGALALQKFAGSKEVQKWAKDISKAVGSALNAITGGFGKILNDPKVQKSLSKLGASIAGSFKEAGPTLAKVIPDLVKFGQDALPGILDGVSKIFGALPKVAEDMKIISGDLAHTGKEFGDTISGIGGFVAGLLGFLRDADAGWLDWMHGVHKRRDEVVAFFANIPAALVDIGRHIVDGLVGGISGAWGAVTSTVQGLVNSIPLAVRKLLGIASPSKVFHQIGTWVGRGLNNGLLGSVDQIKTTSSKLATAITDQFKAGTIGKGAETAALGQVSKMTARLKVLSTERAKVLDKLANLKSNRASLQTDTYEATRTAGDITTFAAPGDAILGLQALVGKTKTFTADLNKLSKKGIGTRMLSQLVNGWQSDPDGALATANGLLANPTDLKQIIGLQTQLQSAAGALGRAAGADIYGQQIATTQRDATLLSKEMQHIAGATLNKVAKETHFHFHISGALMSSKSDVAKYVVAAIKEEVKKGGLPRNVLTAL